MGTYSTLLFQEISLGWKPGAISKRLLRKLNKAKQQISPIQRVKTTKKAKKHVEDKPTLTISKINGEYRVEMQVSPKNSDTNIECSPLVYKIARADNEDRIKQRERKQRRLVREAVSKVWKDPYHPEVCEKTCLKAYKQAIGLLPYDPNKPECICSDKGSPPQTLESCSCEDVDVSSECSSLELDWEIHFTPPSAYHV